MICSACSHENRAGAKFCEECAAPLLRSCPTCGSDVRPAARFCDSCGASLVAGPVAKAETRKVVTIVFADLIGSTSLHERLDPESVSRVMERYHRTVRVPVEAHGGTVVQLLGDGVMCAFGVPQMAEDDAIRAVRAAAGIQQAFREFAREHAEVVGDVGLRVAVNTGEVVVSDDYAAGIGDPLNVAARLQQEARDGDVLIGEATARVVRERVTLEDVGTFSLKGRSETVTAYRVVSLERPAGAAAVPFVGREDELRRIMAVYESAVAEGRVRLAVILGSPGLGKSRLLDEIGRRLGDGATVLGARCDAAGTATFAPIAEGLRAFLGFGAGGGADDALAAAIAAALAEDTDRERIGAGITALLAATPASPEETFFVIRRFLAALALTRPVVLAIDDLQWAEPLLLDLVEHLVQWGAGTPLLVLAGARPELRDVRSSLTASGGLVSEVVTLAGLDASAATKMAANVIGADLPAAVAGRVLAASEGNPLFLGELVRMLVNDGVLKREGERWTAAVDLATLEMPPTIHALLAARIERLRPEERTVLERAAVIGRQFSRSAVAHLLPRDLRDLDARLEALRRSELIEPDTAWFLGEPALRFHHGLTRDAAYRRILKETRAELHGRLADWITAKVGEATRTPEASGGRVEHDEMIGWHLEQAHQHLRELGPLDANGRALGERAARYLGVAGRRALARDDASPAADLLGRALHVLDAADPVRADLALDWCEALLAAGDVAHARAAIDELGRMIDNPAPFETRPGEGRSSGRTAGSSSQQVTSARAEEAASERPSRSPLRQQAWYTCFAAQLAVLTEPQALRATVDALATAAAQLAELGDHAGEAKAHQVHALALQRLGAIGAAEAALDKALAAARRVNDRRRSNAVLAGAPQAALWGPSPVTRASGRCLDVVRVLRITQGAPAVEAVALRCQAVLEALRGRTDAAQRMIASSRKMVEELGITQQVLETDLYIGLIAIIEDDAAAAEPSLRAAYEGFRTHGLGIDAARAAALLGRALFVLGNVAEAEALSHESEALAGDDLQAAIAWRRVRAETLAARGERAQAVEVARAAVALAGATDALLLHANARMALAAALRAAGRQEEAASEEARAIELWEAKGATVLPQLARRSAGHTLLATDGATTSVAHGARAAVAPVPHVQRRARSNAATALTAGLEEAFRARDLGAVEALCGHRMEIVDHATGATYGREGQIESSRRMMRMPQLDFRIEVLATFGESLSLNRCLVTASGTAGGSFDVANYEIEYLAICELDEAGRCRRWETLAADHLAAAIGRFYERYAELLPDGPDRERAVATARSVPAVLGHDLDRWATALASTVEIIDRRTLGFGAARGAEAMLRAQRSLHDLADDPVIRCDDILALRSDALLFRGLSSGTERAGGGTFERPFLALHIFGAQGLLTRYELFDADRDAEALARFDELVLSPVEGLAGKPLPRPLSQTEPQAEGGELHPSLGGKTARGSGEPAAARFANATTRCLERYVRCWHARDWEGAVNTFAPGCRLLDRRASAGLGAEDEDIVATNRVLFGLQSSRWDMELLATRGERLALFHVRLEAEDRNAGPLEVEWAEVSEVGADGRRVALVLFDADDLDAAYSEIDKRYADGEASAYPGWAGLEGFQRAWAAKDWAALATYIAPGFVLHDHRALGWPTMDAVTWVESIKALVALAPDAQFRRDHVRLREHGSLMVNVLLGTREGGRFEDPRVIVSERDARGRAVRFDFYSMDQLDAALARYEELVSPLAQPSRRRVRPNAATAHAARLDAAMAARDADALRIIAAEQADVVSVDQPSGFTYDAEAALATRLAMIEARDLEFRHEPLATLGDGLALLRMSMSASGVAGGSFDVGPYTRELIILSDEPGRRAELFDPSRLGDAVVRLYERYAELLPQGPERSRVAASARSLAAMMGPLDPDCWAAAYAPEIECIDHRILGTWFGRGAQQLVQHWRALLEVARDVVVRDDDIVDLRPDALLVRRIHLGTDRTGGGAYERQFLLLRIFAADGLLARVEIFDPDQEAHALARVDALNSSPVEARTAAPRFANAATRALDAFERCQLARDWEGIAGVHAADVRGIDRRSLIGFDLAGRDFLASLRVIFEMGFTRWRSEILATRGERLALARSVSETEDGTAVDWLAITEVDAGGRIRLIVAFDPDDLDAAYAELDNRYAAGEAAAHANAWEKWMLHTRAIPARDWAQLASVFAPDLVIEDHRPIGVLAVGSRDEYVASVRSLVDLRPDARLRVRHALALDDRRALTVVGWEGDESEGAFDIHSVVVTAYGADGLRRREDLYGLDQLDAARARYEAIGSAAPRAERAEDTLARFAELRPDPLRIPPNAATRATDRFEHYFAARDWDALRALYAPAMVFDDRRRLIRTTGDREMFLANCRVVGSGTQLLRTLLATAGDRLALERFLWSGAHAGGQFEIETLTLIEVDAEGVCRAAVIFDPDDRRAAAREMLERYARSEAGRAAMFELVRAVLDHDLERCGAAIPADFVFHDHRRSRLARVEGAEAWIAWLATLFEQSPDSITEPLHYVAGDQHGTLSVGHTFGTLPEGGAFESPFVCLWLYRDGRVVGCELFEPEDLDRARARFEELRG